MEYAILGLLLLSPMTIYDLNQNFKKSLSLIYSASYGSLQAALKKLSSQNWVETTSIIENGRQKKIFQATIEGKEAFNQWLYADIPESKLEVTALSKLHFLGLLETDSERIIVLEGIVSQIKSTTDNLINYQEELKEVPRDLPIAKYQLATLDYGVMAHRAALAFFENALAELRLK